MSRCRDLSSLTINSGCCHTDTRPVKCRIPGQCSLCIHVGPLTMLACSPPSPPVDLFTQQLGTSAFPYAVVWPLDRAESLFELLTLMTREWPTFPPAHPTPGQDPLATSRPSLPLPPLTCTSAHHRTGGSPSQAGRPQTTELTAAPSSHSSLSCVLTVAPRQCTGDEGIRPTSPHPPPCHTSPQTVTNCHRRV